MMKELLDAMIDRSMANGDFVGANAAVYKDGKCLYLNSFGMADREAGKPMTRDTIFRIYSMTKPVTAVAVLKLVEQGLIHPDMEVSWFLPEFRDLQVYGADGKPHRAQNPLRIQHLLNMQSGMPYPNCMNQTQIDTASLFGKMEAVRDTDKAYTTREIVSEIAKIPTEFEPGTHWDYGTSADILGALVEVVSGMPYRDFLHKNIFEPLGMTETDFYVHPDKQERFASAYELIDGKLVRDEKCHLGLNDYLSLPSFISGGAGLTSTIEDYAKFANTLANGGVSPDGVRILSPAAFRYMTTPQVKGDAFRADQDWDSLRGYDYGSLVRVLTDPKTFGTLANPGEFGWDGWTGTYFCADPKEHLTILFWIQVACAGTSQTAKLMRNIVYGSLR